MRHGWRPCPARFCGSTPSGPSPRSLRQCWPPLRTDLIVKVCQSFYPSGMATRNISLTEKLDRFVEEQVRSGEYQNASEVVRAALRRLQSDAEERALKIERFKA